MCGLLFSRIIMSKIIFSKPAKSIDEQIALLQSRGMVIDDISFAKKLLSQHNYYRICGYWLPFEKDHNLHLFKDGTTFKEVSEVYFFDRELRLIVFSIIEQIEIAFRTTWAYIVAMRHGCFAYTDSKFAKNIQLFDKNNEKLKREIERSNEDFIKHYLNKYKEPSIPIWSIAEIIPLGLLSKLYKNLSEEKTKKSIANAFGSVDSTLIESWLEHLTVVRNICAHHNRLWNREFTVTPKHYTKPQGALAEQFVSTRKIYNTLIILMYFNSILNNHQNWSKQLFTLLLAHEDKLSYMGFPSDWKDRNIWKGLLSF